MGKIIEIKYIKQLRGSFCIPDYQRGYRWGKQEVLDLMIDLWAFYEAHINGKENSYSLQPLVVKKRQNEITLLDAIHHATSIGRVKEILQSEQEWEVIDGQQRLTTIFILLQALGCETNYTLKYDIIEGSEAIVNSICDAKEEDCSDEINLSYMYDAYKTIADFLKRENVKPNLVAFAQTLLNHVAFIWYVAGDEENSLDIFKRLNIGKISLTESELIKALFLNRDNFIDKPYRLTEIAKEWDSFENMLQDDTFWLFVQSDNSYDIPTRILFLLDFFLAYRSIDKETGRDCVFRTYYKIYNEAPMSFLELWEGIKEVMSVWATWYNDVLIYHLVGYLIYTQREDLISLMGYYKFLPKSKFSQKLFDIIKTNYFSKKRFNIEKNYLVNNCDHKREALPYLLLLNILTVIEQNEVMVRNKQYKLSINNKFPFHLFKREKWDIEHIDSATQNELENPKDQMEWIISVFTSLDKEQQRKLVDISNIDTPFYKHFVLHDGKARFEENEFDAIYKDMQELLDKHNAVHQETILEWKNKIYNFALLDAHTNRSYKNAIFPYKRSEIIDKEKGIRHSYQWDKKEKKFVSSPDNSADSAFVPPCTQNVFKFAYSRNPESFQEWGKNDADMYRKEILRLFVKYKLIENNNGK